MDSPVISFSFESNQKISEQICKNRRRKKVLTGSMRQRDEHSEKQIFRFSLQGFYYLKIGKTT
jgi:ribosomal protein L21